MDRTVRFFPSKLALLPVVLAGVFSAFGAHAVTYSNSYDGDIYSFGSPDTTSYGQVFTLGAASQLNGLSFFATSGSAGDLGLVVADWDGTKAVGPALYSSSVFSYAGGVQALAFNGINLNLNAGTYIAYITTAGIGSAASGVSIAGSSSDGGLAGGFTYLNSSGVDPLTLSDPWYPVGAWAPGNLQYVATFDAAVVPEPETYAMLLAGLGVMGFMSKRRKAG